MSLSLNPCAWFKVLVPMSTGNGVVILAGMQKSGTAAIAQPLGTATGQTVCSDPFYILSKKGIDFRKELYEKQLPLQPLWRRYSNVFSETIIKDPNFSLLIPQIIEFLPGARIVFIMRDPRDTIRSILDRLNLPGNPDEADLSQSEYSGP